MGRVGISCFEGLISKEWIWLVRRRELVRRVWLLLLVERRSSVRTWEERLRMGSRGLRGHRLRLQERLFLRPLLQLWLRLGPVVGY